jgi:hypothetical protein
MIFVVSSDVLCLQLIGKSIAVPAYLLSPRMSMAFLFNAILFSGVLLLAELMGYLKGPCHLKLVPHRLGVNIFLFLRCSSKNILKNSLVKILEIEHVPWDY